MGSLVFSGLLGLSRCIWYIWYVWDSYASLGLLVLAWSCKLALGLFALLWVCWNICFVGLAWFCWGSFGLLGLGRSFGTCSGFVCLLLVGLAFLFSDGRVLD